MISVVGEGPPCDEVEEGEVNVQDFRVSVEFLQAHAYPCQEELGEHCQSLRLCPH